MTTSTRRINPARSSRRAAFTLVEVLVSAAISSFILAGVLAAFVMIGRSGFLASSYSELQTETRRALDIFGEDARKATEIKWNGSQSITLYVATSTNATVTTTYAYDSDRSSPTYQCFYRMLGEEGSNQPRRILVRGVASDFAFQRYKLDQNGGSDNPATGNLDTKQIQLTLRASRTGATALVANQNALSARYILRNKRVSN